MRAALFAALLLPLAAMVWKEGGIIGIPSDNGKRPIGVFVSTEATSFIPAISIPTDQWVTIDLANGSAWYYGGDQTTFQPNVPADAKAVFLSGILFISHPGGNVGTCNLWANFRVPGDMLPSGSYQMQTIEANSGAGSRTNAAVWVPVVDRKFEFYWSHTPGCPSGINLSLQAYVR
jgi:hypothetical protein